MSAPRGDTRAEAVDLWPYDDRWFMCQCGHEQMDADEGTHCRSCGRTGKWEPSPPNPADEAAAETSHWDDWNSWGGR